MIVLVDGYNLLKYMIKKDFATQGERAWLVAQLTDYAQHKKHEVILVFDGGPYERPTFTKKGIVSILYSGARVSADDVIKDYMDRHPLSQLVVVSSDRALYSYAASLRVPTIDTAAFVILMKERKVAPVHIVKSTGKAQKLRTEEVNPELDALMEEGSAVLLYKHDEEKNHKTTKQKLSKEERKLLKISKKL
jgi:hypothetical protein